MKKHFLKFAITGLSLAAVATSCKKNEVVQKQDAAQLVTMMNESDSNAYLQLSGLLYDDLTQGGPIFTTFLAEYQSTNVEEFLMVDIYHKLVQTGHTTAAAQLYNILIVNPELTVAIPSLELTEGDLQQYLSSFEYIVSLDKNFRTSATLNAISATGISQEISSEFNETVKYIVVKRDETLSAVNNLTLTDMDGNSIASNVSGIPASRSFGDFSLYTSEDLHNLDYFNEGLLPTGYTFYQLKTVTNDPPPPPVIGYSLCMNSGRSQNELSGNPKKDQLHTIKFDGIKVIKHFESGWNLPRIELKVTYTMFDVAKGSGSLVDRQIVTHKDDRTTFIPALQLDIATWRYADYGAAWRVDWVEEDKTGDETTLNAGLNAKYTQNGVDYTGNASVSIKMKADDLHMGNVIIEYCDHVDIWDGEIYKVCDVLGQGFYFRERFRP